MDQSSRCRQKGFTFVGVMVMMTIMLITMGAVSDVWHTVMQRENEQELLFIGHQFRKAIGKFYEKSGRGYPASLDELLESPVGSTGKARFLRKIYRDPMTGEAKWGLILGRDGKITGIYSLSEAKPYKVADFIEADNSFKDAEKYSDWKFIYIPARVGSGAGSVVNGYVRPVPRVR